jgi:hypothetical protein
VDLIGWVARPRTDSEWRPCPSVWRGSTSLATTWLGTASVGTVGFRECDIPSPARSYNPAMRHLTVVVAVLALLGSSSSGLPAEAQQIAWEQWQHQVGIVEMGARSDGSLVAMVAGRLFLVSAATGATTPFAAGADGFSADPNAEPYFIVSPALALGADRCSWTADDLYILDLTSPPGIARVDSSGHATRFAPLAGVDTLGGIALDTTGQFDHRLLVTGTHGGNQTTVFAVDCGGAVTTLTDSAPQVEGGIAVAPPGFGQFAGDLIAPDENSGQVWAIDPSGKALLVALPSLPTGGDTGVESAGFVPAGFLTSGGGFAYLADRGTPNNPFPGTDTILRLSAAALASAGVQEGDLLVATEGNGTTVAIHCAESCTSTLVARGTNGGHIEGHIALVTAP